jgi:hypothetical protein
MISLNKYFKTARGALKSKKVPDYYKVKIFYLSNFTVGTTNGRDLPKPKKQTLPKRSIPIQLFLLASLMALFPGCKEGLVHRCFIALSVCS